MYDGRIMSGKMDDRKKEGEIIVYSFSPLFVFSSLHLVSVKEPVGVKELLSAIKRSRRRSA